MRFRRFACLAFAACLAPTFAADLDSAIALYNARNFPAARTALEAVVAAEPRNAAACYYLGMALRRRGDDKALDDAVVWLEKAVTLAPTNANYLADYGGTSLQLAAKNRSLGAATRGRDAMEKSLKLDPTNIDARVGLMQFYLRAPWPLGSDKKAAEQLAAIRRLDPARATFLEVISKTNAKDYAGAFQICEQALAKDPQDYTALYYYGRTASISGQNLEPGLRHLQKCLTITEPGPSAPSHSDVWNRIGVLQEKRSLPREARVAYETALQLNPGNRQAAESLARLR